MKKMRVNRREMLAGLAAGGCGLREQEQVEIDPSLYIPKAHLVEDRKLLHDFMDQYPFVDLVTSWPTLRITHLPVVLNRTAGDYGRIFGHISRQNPQIQAFDERHPGVVVFRGPHGYISPTWFARTDIVPTWNFAVVHASGRPKAITGKKELHDMLGKLIGSLEKYRSAPYDFSKLPESYVSAMMEGIVGFEMPVESLEGKFKLGQSWSEEDKRRVLEHLRREAQPSLYDLSASFYRLPSSRP